MILVLVLVLAVIFVAITLYVIGSVVVETAREIRRRRAERPELDATVATAFRALHEARTPRDLAALAGQVDGDVLAGHERRLEQLERAGAQMQRRVAGDPMTIHVAGSAGEADEPDRRAVLLVEAAVEDAGADGGAPVRTTVTESWTLGRRDGRWVVLAIRPAG